MNSIDVVIATRNRVDELLRTIDRLSALPERPTIIVVDNASDDGSPDAVTRHHPEARLIRLPGNLGAAARNAGVAVSSAPYVAFSDDDSWWAAGALTRAARIMDAHPRLALLAARVLVGLDQGLDPICSLMGASPLPGGSGPGPAVLGFVACGTVVRRIPFLRAGGFDRHYGIGGEEELLAMDMASSGWQLCCCDDVVAHHYPAVRRDSASRRRRQTRNALWTAWLRRRPSGAMRRTMEILERARRDPGSWAGVRDAMCQIDWIARERRPVSRALEGRLRLLADCVDCSGFGCDDSCGQGTPVTEGQQDVSRFGEQRSDGSQAASPGTVGGYSADVSAPSELW